MLDLDRIRRVKLHRRPLGQRLFANLFLLPDYHRPRQTKIVIEDLDRIPKEGGMFLAMNHTDRYNNFPLQYFLYKHGFPFTASWVKGKYYENPFLGWFMDSMNNIPLPSRGYILTTAFRQLLGRPPEEAEYRALRDIVDGKQQGLSGLEGDARRFATEFASGASFSDRFEQHFNELVAESMALTRHALFDLGLHVLVFPDGTRSKRLGRGHTGLAQVAQHLGVNILPIGCTGSDRLFPGNLPFSKGGTIVYRVGEPIDLSSPELSHARVPKEVAPLTRAATVSYGNRYRALTDLIMNRINELVDEEYRFHATSASATEEKGVRRFV